MLIWYGFQCKIAVKLTFRALPILQSNQLEPIQIKLSSNDFNGFFFRFSQLSGQFSGIFTLCAFNHIFRF